MPPLFPAESTAVIIFSVPEKPQALLCRSTTCSNTECTSKSAALLIFFARWTPKPPGGNATDTIPYCQKTKQGTAIKTQVSMPLHGCGYNSSGTELSASATAAAPPASTTASAGFCSTNSSDCFPSPASSIETPESLG